MKKQIIYGPPGTGKTTYLMSLLEEELLKLSPNQIAFVSFTRKGTYEGVSRAKEKFGLKETDLIYFKTLHSLCFKALSASRMDMVGKTHYKLLSKTTGINFTGYYTEDFSSSNDTYLHVVAMEKHNPKLAKKLLEQLQAKKFRYIKFQYEEMKTQLGLLDFDDLLINYLKKGEPLNVKTAFIDEGQDLTLLQWKVAEKMFSKVEKLYVAGDDDQAVYEWSGADVNSFLNFSSDKIILNKSYRMPETILRLSKKITRDIKKRQTKEFKANGSVGTTEYCTALNKVDLKGGELIVARTNWLLRSLSFEAMEQGFWFKFKGKSSVDKNVIKAIKAYENYQKGKGTPNELASYSMYFRQKDSLKTWQNALKLPKYQIAYYEKILTQDSLEKKPLQFETFHSSKGSENDHVILSSDLTKLVQDNFWNNMDSELRCLYVGMTRAKSKLTVLDSKNQEHYPDKYFK